MSGGVYLSPWQSAAVACWLDGLTNQQAAAAIGCTKGAYLKMLAKALRLLGQGAALDADRASV